MTADENTKRQNASLKRVKSYGSVGVDEMLKMHCEAEKREAEKRQRGKYEQKEH